MNSSPDVFTFRVWPEGTIQESEDQPHEWMSDDYLYVDAEAEEDALNRARELGFI